MSFDLAAPKKSAEQPKGIDAVPTSPPTEVAHSPSGEPPKATPETRATTFQSQQDDSVSPKGVKLMAGAYALAFGFLFLYVMWLWRRQGDVNKRLADLEKEIDKAAAKSEKP